MKNYKFAVHLPTNTEIFVDFPEINKSLPVVSFINKLATQLAKRLEKYKVYDSVFYDVIQLNDQPVELIYCFKDACVVLSLAIAEKENFISESEFDRKVTAVLPEDWNEWKIAIRKLEEMTNTKIII